MPESRSSDPSEPQKPKDFSSLCAGLGLVAVSAGAALFHPGYGLILGGLSLIAIGIFGAPRRA